MAYPLTGSPRSGALRLQILGPTIYGAAITGTRSTFPNGTFASYPRTAAAIHVHGFITPPATGQMWPRGKR